MTSLLYLHGFNSSPGSDKARQTDSWLRDNFPQVKFLCPLLSPYPRLAMVELESIVASTDLLGLVGSSMGGFYATWLAEKYDLRAVLVNPVVDPWLGRDYLLGDQENYHTGEIHRIEQTHLDQLQQYNVIKLKTPARFMVLIQRGDEVLDYRLAVNKYADSEVHLEDYGDHSFTGYQNHLPNIVKFLLGDTIRTDE